MVGDEGNGDVGYGVPLHTLDARLPHVVSHRVLQQYGSVEQILAVHSASSEHPLSPLLLEVQAQHIVGGAVVGGVGAVGDAVVGDLVGYGVG